MPQFDARDTIFAPDFESIRRPMSNLPEQPDEIAAGVSTESGATRREPLFNLPPIVVAFMVVCVGVHLARLYLLSDDQNFEVILNGAFIPLRYSGQYDLDLFAFTSPFTSSLLHAGWMHLVLNMVWLAAFASPLATRIGPVRFVLFWCFATAASLLLHYLAHAGDMIPVIGASGAISGMMGAAARFGFRTDRSSRMPNFVGRRLSLRETFQSRQVVVFLGVWLLINFAAGAGLDLSGSDGSIAWEAHIGGMLAGLFGIALFDRNSRRGI
jgi:membrane associated rhomboid family serine protease